MNKLFYLLFSIVLFSCQKKSELPGKQTDQQEPNKIILKSVTVDFNQVPDMQPAIYFKGRQNQGIFSFSYTDGLTQTKLLPAFGTYSITYSFLDCDLGCFMNIETSNNFYDLPHANYSIVDTLSGFYSMIMACATNP